MESLTGPTKAAPLRGLAEDLVRFIRGKIKGGAMAKRLRKLLAPG